MPRRISVAHRNDAGFTLVEMLIVIVVLGILAGIAVFGVAQFRTDSVAAACVADKEIVTKAANAYAVQQGSFPADLADLESAGYVKDPPAGVSYTFDVAAKKVNQGPCNL